MIYTVFPDSEFRLPADFPTYEEAEEYGEELKADYEIDYTIESTTGECV